jgi:hypothetical protein
VLTICFFYCIPFAKFLFFAMSPLLVLFALFVLKRGVVLARPGLRQTAFLLMFMAAFKLFMVDLRIGKGYLLCERGFPLLPCSAKGFMIIEILGILLLLLASVMLFHFYRVFMVQKKASEKTPEQVNLRFWANISLTAVMVMMAWLAAPWAGFLTVGYVPKLFTAVAWQHLAVVTLGLLLVGFWKAESCVWTFDTHAKTKRLAHMTKTWTPKDTLWLCVFLYLITLGLSYVAHDILSQHSTQPSSF